MKFIIYWWPPVDSKSSPVDKTCVLNEFIVDLNYLYVSLVIVLRVSTGLAGCRPPHAGSPRMHFSFCQLYSMHLSFSLLLHRKVYSATVWGTPVLRGSGFKRLLVWMSLVLYGYAGKVRWPVRAPSAQHDNILVSLCLWLIFSYANAVSIHWVDGFVSWQVLLRVSTLQPCCSSK